MILAFHSIWSCYGFWLPNEPRGSWSDFVRNWDLFQFGPAKTVSVRHSIAHHSYDREAKRRMQRALEFDPVRLTGSQAQIIGQSLQALPYVILALAIMPNHVHAVIGYTSRDIRRVVGHIKSEATRQLRRKGWFLDRSPWCQHGWNVYLDSDADVRRAINYVRNNPSRDGLPLQNWNCVKLLVPGALEEARRERRR